MAGKGSNVSAWLPPEEKARWNSIPLSPRSAVVTAGLDRIAEHGPPPPQDYAARFARRAFAFSAGGSGDPVTLTEHMAKFTSLYLPPDVKKRWKDSGLPLGAVIVAGMDAIAPVTADPQEEALARAVRGERERAAAAPPPRAARAPAAPKPAPAPPRVIAPPPPPPRPPRRPRPAVPPAAFRAPAARKASGQE
jgi:hypothetical protein